MVLTSSASVTERAGAASKMVLCLYSVVKCSVGHVTQAAVLCSFMKGNSRSSEDTQGRQDWLSVSGGTDALRGPTTVGSGEGQAKQSVWGWGGSDKLNVQSKDQ